MGIRSIFEIKSTSSPLVLNTGDSVGAGGTDKGSIVDTAGYNGLIILMNRYTGSATAGYAFISLQEWIDENENPSSPSDPRWQDVDSSVFVQGFQGQINYDDSSLVATSAAYIGNSRFILPLIVGSDDITGGTISCRQYGFLTHAIRG